MNKSWLRAAQKLRFQNPADFLFRLRQAEPQIAGLNVPQKVKNLRTNELKEWREARQAALFCHGVGQRIGQTIFFAQEESQDYDFVASWIVGDKQHLAPVQLKEVVPLSLNPTASIQAILAKIEKYKDSEELTVAIHLNQNSVFNPSKLSIPQLDIAALWIFYSTSPDQSVWALWGNFLETPEITYFNYPA